MEVHDLCDQPTADEAEAQSRLSQTGRDYTPASMPAAKIAVAAAPVSFGAFEVTVGVDPSVPEASYVLDAVAAEGYEGIDLGPPGYLGTQATLGRNLQQRRLHLAGGFISMPFSEPAGMVEAMTELATVLDLFDATGPGEGAPRPKPTLADAGSAARRAAPGQAQRQRSLGLKPGGWERLAENVQAAAALCRSRGYDPTFHHHAGTYIEAPWEIDELLKRTDVGLCFDTGHLALGGGSPEELVLAWQSRINHVHLKDIRRTVIAAIIREGAGMMEVWRRGAFCRLGTGDLDIDAILSSLRHGGYQGWLVIEQDVIPGAGVPGETAALDQDRNRAYLRERGI
jgi:inosose dehydratase